MTIRKKIFLLAGILLALFGVVVGVLATIQKLAGDQIGNIVDYELPLSRLLAEFDVDTDRYELRILRLLQARSLPVRKSSSRQSPRSERSPTRCVSDVWAATELLDQAIKDPHYQTAEDRVDLARIEGSFKYLSRSLEEFLAIGDTTMGRARRMAGATRHGPPRSASRSSREAFGPDLSEIRRDVADLTEKVDPAWSSRASGSIPI